MEKEKFECCFELPHKGIYLEVRDNNSHVDLSMFVNNEHIASVCINDLEELDRLIKTLQSHKKRKYGKL